MTDKTLSRAEMTWQDMQELLAENGYHYGQDAAENALVGYELALRAESEAEPVLEVRAAEGTQVVVIPVRELTAPALDEAAEREAFEEWLANHTAAVAGDWPITKADIWHAAISWMRARMAKGGK